MGTLDNLYPPVINTYMPAFVVNEDGAGEIKVYFSISKYNSKEDIGQVWVSVNDQFTNMALINTPSGFLLTGVEEDSNKIGDDRYYVKIKNSNLLNGKWEKNKDYKVQIRFSNIPEENLEDEKEMIKDSFIIKNLQYFSEWSTVCLIYPILQPQLELKSFDENLETIFSSMRNSIVGKVSFKDEETLDSYRIKIYEKHQVIPVFDSGEINTGIINSNEINYTLKYGFLDGEHYELEVDYLTSRLYSETKRYSFLILDPVGKELEATLYVTPEKDLGRIKINLVSDKEYYFGNMTIRRASGKTNFTIWEDVHNFVVDSSGFIDYTWYDYSIESGIWYQYCIQKRSSYGDRGLIVKGIEQTQPLFSSVMKNCEKPHSKNDFNKQSQSIVYLEDIFLSGENGKHLKIKFNPQINSFTHTLLESSVQTIGSKYPFIRRNADVDYRQFPISGLISYHMDDGNLFTDKEELLNSPSLYEDFNKQQGITDYNDFTLEREFRKRVKEFLYNGKVKLFKSASEGNILIRLMNISLTPNASLGRMVYSFSATAYEIDDLTIENLDKYNIQPIDEIQDIVSTKYEIFKQNIFEIKENGYKDLKALISEVNLFPEEGIVKTIKGLKNLEIEIEGPPYPIVINEKGYSPLFDSSEQGYFVSGYLLQINGEAFYVNADGYFSINPELNLEISDLKILNPYENDSLKVTTLATLIVEEREDETTIPQSMNIYRKVGQINEEFRKDDNIVEFIFNKYYMLNGKEYQKVVDINSIRIETDPYTLLKLKDSLEDGVREFLIGETGVLNLEEKDFMLEGLWYAGINDPEKPKLEAPDSKYISVTYFYDLEKGAYKKEKGVSK